MGANNSMLSQKVVTDVSTEILNQSITNFVNDRSINMSSTQTLMLDGASSKLLKCGSFTVNQTAKTTMGVLLDDKNNAAANITNSAINEIQNKLSTKTDQANSGLPMLQMNNTMSKQDIYSKVKTTMTNQLETNIKNQLKIENNNKQVIYFTLPENVDVSGACDFSQTSVQEMLAQSTVKNVVDQLLQSQVVSKTAADVSSSVTQSNTFTLLGFLGGGLITFIIIVAIIYVIFSRRSSASPAPPSS